MESVNIKVFVINEEPFTDCGVAVIKSMNIEPRKKNWEKLAIEMEKCKELSERKKLWRKTLVYLID